MIASAITSGDVTVTGVIPKHMDSLSAKLREMNCQVDEKDDWIRVRRDGILKSQNIKTTFYPGFPTDLQPQVTALLCMAQGTSIITETVWEHRFQYVNELKRLGANITVEGRIAVIDGARDMTGAQVTATDLRAGAALVIAGLVSKGETCIGNVKYLDRGYENFVSKFNALGADIKRIKKNNG